MKRLFVSDLHLSEPTDPPFRTFRRLMAESAGRFDEIYLLGDVCEVWVGDDDDGPMARALVDSLADAARQSSVFVMAGNRDFLFGADFARDAGVRLIDDPWLVDGDVLLAHGDAFCTDDTAYQEARAVLRSAAWQGDVLSRPLQERRALAESMRAQSRATNANKAENIMDVSPDAVAAAVHDRGARTLIHGHTHRPGIHVEPWGRRYVLGAWEHCGWRLEETDGEFALICFGLLR